MFYLSDIGKEQLKKTFPDYGCKQTTCRLFISFVDIYIRCITTLYILYKNDMTTREYYYYINLGSTICMVSCILNIIFTVITTHKITGDMEQDVSFLGAFNRGRFKLGVFQRGSILRHVVLEPILNGGIIDTLIFVSTIVLTNIPYTHIDPKIIFLGQIILYCSEVVTGIITTVVINNGNAFSTTPVIGFACCSKNTITPTKSDNSPEDDNINIEDNGPYYRSFIV